MFICCLSAPIPLYVQLNVSTSCLLNALPVYPLPLPVGPPPIRGPGDQLSSASIFEHVDRMSRATEGPRRFTNKIQLIAMQPMPALPAHSPTVVDRAAENANLNKEVCAPNKQRLISCPNTRISPAGIRLCFIKSDLTRGFCVCVCVCV